MDRIKQKIKSYINNQEFSKALEELTRLLEKDSGNNDWLILRGDIYYLKQEYSKALNDYNKVLKKESDNKTIASKVEIIKDILKFQAIDIYASTNLNKDPWLDD
jgi:tetratricopeptide (TPR) repeat protein